MFIIIRSFQTKSYTRLLLLTIILLFMGITVSDGFARAAVAKTPRLNVKNLSMKKGSSYKLRIYNMDSDYTVNFNSSDSSVVTIKAFSSSAKLKAKSSGTAIIKATITDDDNQIIASLNCNVTVTPPAVSAKFIKKKVILSPGQTRKLKISLKPSTAYEQLRFTSDNPDIVSISSNGTITAYTEGSTVVRVSIQNGKGGICKVHVIAKNSDHTANSNSVNNVPDNSAPDSSVSDKLTGSNTSSGINSGQNSQGNANAAATPLPKKESGSFRAKQTSEE